MTVVVLLEPDQISNIFQGPCALPSLMRYLSNWMPMIQITAASSPEEDRMGRILQGVWERPYLP